MHGEAAQLEVTEASLASDSPVAQSPFRYATEDTEDTEISGVTILKGEPVMMSYAASTAARSLSAVKPVITYSNPSGKS